MMLLTISYLFLLSFDSHLNVPLNNEDEWNLYLLCYRLCKIGQEWWQKFIPWNCSNHFTVVQPRNDSHSFLKGGKGNRDGFQALSQKCSTDPSPASWQCLFLFLLSVYLTDNILFFPNFFFFWSKFESPDGKKNVSVELKLKYFWGAEWNNLVQFSSSSACQRVASWHLWFIALLISKLSLQLRQRGGELVLFTLSVPIRFCGHLILPNFWIL